MVAVSTALLWSIGAASYLAAGTYRGELVLRHGEPNDLSIAVAESDRLPRNARLALHIAMAALLVTWPIAEMVTWRNAYRAHPSNHL